MTKSKTTKRALLSSCVALMLCFSMLLGTTYAWFTDEVTSTNNIIKSGTLDAEMNWKAKLSDEWTDASEGPIFTYEYWEPGYVDVKYIQLVNAGDLAFNYQLRVVPDNAASDGMKLAEAIDVYVASANTDVDAINRKDVSSMTKLGTLKELMVQPTGVDDGILLPADGKGSGNVVIPTGAEYYTGDVALCVALKMREDAGNEYQNLSIGDGFAVKLLATQYTYENDSFDNMYDEWAEGAAPIAIVDVIGEQEVYIAGSLTPGDNSSDTKMKLDTSFQFQPSESYEQAQKSPYRFYHADYVVSADKDIPGDSVALAGFYQAFADYLQRDVWVAMESSEKIEKGTPIRLVELLGATVNYQEICQFGNDGTGFLCGIAVKDAEAVAGTTITVELRLYETTKAPDATSGTANEETGEYVTIGTYTYTVPAVKVANNAELDAAIKDGVAEVELGSGTYIIPDSAKGKTLTIVGNGDTVIATQDDGSYEGCDYSLDGSTVTFENVTINTDSSTYTGYARLNATYNNCTINGTYTLYGDSEFNNCTFNVSGDVYNIWTWGAPNATFNKCTFNSDGKAMLLYGTVNTKLTLNDCVFNDNGGLTDLKAAVEIGNDYDKSYELIVNKTTVNGYEINDKGINTGTTLWGNKNSMGTDKLNVVVDGVDVY